MIPQIEAGSLFFYILLGLGIIISLGILLILGFALLQHTVTRRINLALKAGKKERILFFPPLLTALFSKPLEKLEKKLGPRVISLSGLNSLWIEGFSSKSKPLFMKKALSYIPGEALYPALLATSKKPVYLNIFKDYLKEARDTNLIRRIALAAEGNLIPAREIFSLLSDYREELELMIRENDWKLRFFAFQILIQDTLGLNQEILEKAYSDPDFRIRKYASGSSCPEGKKERIYSLLFTLLSEDPVAEVRQKAKDRIVKDFSSLYKITSTDIGPEQSQRILCHLTPGIKEDEEFSLTHLTSENLELRLPAARYLDNSGYLVSLLYKVNFIDREEMKRAVKLLSAACEVKANGFLKNIASCTNPGALLVAVKLAFDFPWCLDVKDLAEAVFGFFKTRSLQGEYKDLYKDTLNLLYEYGDSKALELLKQEILERKQDQEELALLLKAVPPKYPRLLVPFLLGFLKDPAFLCFSELRATLVKFPDNTFLVDLLLVLEEGSGKIHRKSRIEALRLLSQLSGTYCIQIILENLYLLPQDEAKQVLLLLSKKNSPLLEKHIQELLNCLDSHVKAGIVSSLPVLGKKGFIPSIRKALNDPEPRVRIASARALSDFEEPKLVSLLLPLLRDPCEEVRAEAALVLASRGGEEGASGLRGTLKDPNEIEPVKLSLLQGLAQSRQISALEILMENLGKEELQEAVIKALAVKTDKAELSRILELSKGLSAPEKKVLLKLLKPMPRETEINLLALLTERDSPLREAIIYLMETSGYVEKQISRLRDREPEVRQEAAKTLALLATKDSYRGIVLAARDPAGSVRIEAMKALDNLGEDEKISLLEKLSNDPDKRVRNYARWVLEHPTTKD